MPAEGNIFFGSQAPKLDVVSKAASVRWTVTDFWRRPVASGELATGADHRAVLVPGIAVPGYYFATFETPEATLGISFAVVPELAAKRPADTPFGVMTHFAQGMPTDILPLLQKLGVTSVRDEHYWDQVETQPGTFIFPERNVGYMQALKASGIDPLIAMTFANKLYDDGLTPHTDEGRAAYGRYGQELLKQWPDQIKWLEIWNEYNGTWCKGPAASDRPKYYAKMLKTAYEHIKAVRPDVKVLGCATVVIPLPYLEGIFKNGGLKHMDAVVLHPYRGAPEGVDVEVREVEAMIRKYNDGKDKPIWITETGRHDTSEDDWEKGRKYFEKGRRNVASYLVRQFALLMTCNVEKIHWYLCRDYQNFVSMGLLRNIDDPMGRYAVAPAYVAYATLIRQMEGYRFIAREPSGPMTHLLRFDVGGAERWIVWSVQPETLSFTAVGPVQVVDVMGRALSLHPVGGRVSLTLDEYPLFVTGLTGIAEKSLVSLAAPQTVDLLARPSIDVAVDAEGADFVAGGRTFTLKRGANKVELDANPAAATDERTWPYVVNVAGKPIAAGVARVDVRDPLVLADVSMNVAEKHLVATLRNTSSSQTYQIKGMPFASLAPGESRLVTWPVPDAKPFTPTPVDVSVQCQDRPELKFRGTLAWTPWGGGHVLKLPEGCKAWGASSITGALTLEREETGLRLKGKVAGLTGQAGLVVVFGANASSWERREIALDSDGNLDFRLAWKEIPGVNAASRSMRFAFAVYADRDNPAAGVVEWPAGVASGLEPGAFATLLRAGEAEVPKAVPSVETSTTWESLGWLADSEADFSKTQGHNGGFYGYYDGKGGGEGDGQEPDGSYSDDDFKPMQHVETMWGYEWSGPYKYLKLTAGSWHPAARDGLAIWSVRRWISPVTGFVRITGQFIGGAKGDGTGFKILVDGVVKHSARAGGGDGLAHEFNVVVPVQKEGRVDFACTPGVGVNTEYDASRYVFRIEHVKAASAD